MSEAIGTIFTYQNTPAVDRAFLQLKESCVLRIGQFVSIESKDAEIVAYAVSIFRLNPFFEQMNSDFSALKEKFPVSEWHTTVAELKILGCQKGKKILRVSNPPFAGDEVYFAKPEQIKSFLGFTDSGLLLGHIEAENDKKVDVKINVSKLLQKHLAILAMSGAGKSYAVSVLLEELLDLKKEDGQLGIVLFDLHGEYKSFADPADKGFESYHNKTKYYDASKMRFALHSLSDGFLLKILGSTSDVQQRELMPILRKLKESNKKIFDFKDLLEEIENSILAKNIKAPLISWLNMAESMDIFSKTSTFDIFSLVEPGKLTIIDLSDILNVMQKQIVVSYISQKLFDLRRIGKISPFVIVLEEAHNFIPQKASEDFAIARPVFETIAREGRKFGACLCLISQRPINLSTTVLSQCNTHLLLRIINPNDLKHIAESSEGMDARSISMITTLNVGEGLLVGSAVTQPLFFKVRERKSQPNKYELDLQQMSKQFSGKKDVEEKDLDLYI